jgi:phospholipid-translocating ATPase
MNQNSMVFRECSIGGKVYSGDPPQDDLTTTSVTADVPPASPPPVSSPRGSGGDSSTAIDSHNEATATTAASIHSGIPPPPKTKPRFVDATLTADLAAAVHASPRTPNAEHARALHGFFSVLALCHTVLVATDAEGNITAYKAQSPDEAALVQAAADVGYVFRGREREILLLQTPFCAPGTVERYELLNILEFTSARKRMSVVMRKLRNRVEGEADGEGEEVEGAGQLFLLCKGADNVIFERLKKGTGEEMKVQTEEHLDEFAGNGLRTLTLAYKVLQGASCSRCVSAFAKDSRRFCRG